MKKLLLSLLVLVFLIPFSFAEAAKLTPDSSIKVYLDGKPLTFDVDPIQTNGATLVQFAPIFKALGMKYEWNNKMQSISGKKQDLFVHLRIRSNIAVVNGVNVRLQTAPIIYENRTLVPLRFVSEATGMKVNWNAAAKKIDITSVKNPVLLKKPDYTAYTFGVNVNMTLEEVKTTVASNISSDSSWLEYKMPYRNTLSDVRYGFDENNNFEMMMVHTNDKNMKGDPWDTYFTFLTELISVFGEPNDYYRYGEEELDLNYPYTSDSKDVEKMYRNVLINEDKGEYLSLVAQWYLGEFRISLSRMNYAEGPFHEDARGIVFSIVKNSKESYTLYSY